MRNPLSFLLIRFLKESKIRINEEELEFQLNSHPTYPSLHSVTGVLDHFSIKNFALEVPKSIEIIEKIPNNFLAYMQGEGYNGFALVKKQRQACTLIFDEKQSKEFSFDRFLDAWSGVVVILDEENQGTIHATKKSILSPRNVLIAAGTLLSIAFFYQSTIFPAIHFLLTLVGISICILILFHEFGINSRLLSKICHEGSKTINCDAVLKSKGSNLFGYFKLSDIGITYFISLFLLWMIIKISNASYYPIYIISLLAIPFTFFSIYYQFRIVKGWCLLCLSVVSILWLQAISLLLSGIHLQNIILEKYSIISAFLCFTITYAVWQFISSKLKKEQELNILKIEHYKFKKNYNIFSTLINRNERLNTKIDVEKEIIFYSNSSQNSLIEVVFVTNPLCGFCKEAHLLAEKLLELNDKEIKIVIRFNVSENLESNDNKIAQRIIDIYGSSQDECIKALHDIYSANSSSEEWFIKWGEHSTQETLKIIGKEKEWCKTNRIDFTPEILVNGLPFPKEYDRSDLLYFIDELIDEEIEKVNSFNVETSIAV